MKLIKMFLLISILALSLNGFGQKQEKSFFDGYLKNEPKEYIPEKAYTVKYATSEWFKEKIKEHSIDLELKGFTKGNGYSIIIVSDDPELVSDVIEDKNLQTGTTTYKGVVKATSNHMIKIVTEDNELAYEFTITPKLFLARSEALGVKATKAEALEQNKEIIEKKSDYLKKVYVKELLNEYQEALDSYFGKYNKPVKYRIYKIKPKKFNYDDYNSATDKFISAVSSEIINKEEISAAIAIWEKCKEEYQPGKKTRICDVNIDALHLNLAQAYLAKEDYENAKLNMDKCISIKGNSGTETMVNQFFAMQLDHFENYPISRKNFSPKSMLNKNTIRNRNLFFNLILSYRLTETHREIRILQDYYPVNTSSLREVNALHYLDDYIQEKLIIKYNDSGAPISTNYKLLENKEVTKDYYFVFNYNEDKITSVDLNGRLKYEIKYDGDFISEIHYNPGRSQGMIYVFDYSDPEKININVSYIMDGVEKESTSRNYVILTEEGYLKRYLLDVYSSKDQVYDKKGNLIGMKGENESTGVEYTINFISEFDDRGLVIKRKLNETDEYYIERRYTYLFE